ncbi:MAG: pantetheine-phosphate adenylyltransferase [Thermoplasmata archaeon]
MRVLLGGTFSILHKAHREMILRGAKMGDLFIGVTSDKYEFNKKYNVPPFKVREEKLLTFLSENKIRARISPLEDPYGKTLDPYFDAIVVSNETIDFVRSINFKRKSLGIKPLFIENIGTILAEDLMPIKSERIIKGQIDENGRRLKEIILGVASENPEKIKGVEKFAKNIFTNFRIEKYANRTEINQPFGDEIFISAEQRIKEIPDDVDYAIGIEAGIIKIGSRYYDIHYSLIRDGMGNKLSGMSSGLPIKEQTIQFLKEGKNLEEATDNLVGTRKSGENKGAIYYFSDGRKERWELVYESIMSAFISRISEMIPLKY